MRYNNAFVANALKDERVQYMIAQIVEEELKSANDKLEILRKENQTSEFLSAKLHVKIELMETVIKNLQEKVKEVQSECEELKVDLVQKYENLEAVKKENFGLSASLGDLQATTKLMENKAKYFQKEMDSRKAEYEASLSQARAETQKLIAEIEGKTVKINDLENSLSDMCKNMDEKTMQLNSMIERLKSESDQLKVNLTENEKQLETEKKENYNLSGLIGVLKATEKLTRSKIKNLEQELISKNANHELSLEKARAENEKLAKDINEKTLQINGLENSLTEKCQNMNARIKFLLGENNNLRSIAGFLKSSNQSAEDTLNEHKIESESLKKTVCELEQQLKLAQYENLESKSELLPVKCIAIKDGLNCSNLMESMPEKSDDHLNIDIVDSSFYQSYEKDIDIDEASKTNNQENIFRTTRRNARVLKPAREGVSTELRETHASKSAVQRRPVRQNSDLRIRIKKGRQSKKFICNECPKSKSFANVAALLSHTRHRHFHKNSELIPKRKRFTSRFRPKKMDVHDGTHGIPNQPIGPDESLHFCECGRSYSTRKERNRHITKMNTGQLFNCSECKMCFYTTSHLRKHMIRDHKQEFSKYGCRKCGEIFETMSDLKTHRVSKH